MLSPPTTLPKIELGMNRYCALPTDATGNALGATSLLSDFTTEVNIFTSFMTDQVTHVSICSKSNSRLHT